MNRLLLAGVMLAALAAPAWAVNVQIVFGGSTYTYAVSAATAARFQAWAAVAYPTVPNPAYVTPCGAPLAACLPQTIPNPDPIKSVADATFAGWSANLQSFEHAAAVAAVAPPAPVN